MQTTRHQSQSTILGRNGKPLALPRSGFTSLDTDARSVGEAQAKSHLIGLIRHAGLKELAEKVEECCSEYRAFACINGHVFDPVPVFRCRYRLCSDCARERQRRTFARVYPSLLEFRRRYQHDRVVLITLTVRSSRDPLAEIDTRFKKWFAKLRRTKEWKTRIRGAVAGFEFTHNKRHGWHYHCHILAFRKAWWPQPEIASLWKEVTGGAGRIADIREVRKLRGGVEEVLKYPFKPADVGNWTPDLILEFDGLRRRKLSECYGELRGLKIDSEDDLDAEPEHSGVICVGAPCPQCGEALMLVTLLRELLVVGYGGCDSS